MQLIDREEKCCICGYERSFLTIGSCSSFGSTNLDLKPVNSNKGFWADIHECPNCHYCNYNISKSIIDDCGYREWNKFKSISKLKYIKNTTIRRWAILAEEYNQANNYEKLYSSLVTLSWITRFKKSKDYRDQAIEVFYDKLMPGDITKLVQVIDLTRQNKRFGESKLLVHLALKEIDNVKDPKINNELMKEIIDYETLLISNHDFKEHNISEIKDDKEEE